MGAMEVMGIIVAVVTFPVSIVALIVDALFSVGFWNAWIVILVLAAIMSNQD